MCQHENTETRGPYAYSCCVAWPENDCDPRSHGNIMEREVCQDCGATRQWNLNRHGRECSGWRQPEPS